MNNNLGSESLNFGKGRDTNSVTHLFANTHCIICGSAFIKPRSKKLYCSSNCKQFGYYHKNEIKQALTFHTKGINSETRVFYIDDYFLYDKKQKMLRRYRILEKKRLYWESLNQELIYKEKIGSPISDYLLNSHANKNLTQDEAFELYHNEVELEESILRLVPKELSLEQWSFLKSLHTLLDALSFFEIVSSLSFDFFEQLKLKDSSTTRVRDEYSIIKNKFINHCNQIALGNITFEKKETLTDS